MPIRRGIGPLLLLIGIIHVMLKVPLSAIPLIVPADELSIILRVLFAHLIKELVEVTELIGEKVAERRLRRS